LRRSPNGAGESGEQRERGKQMEEAFWHMTSGSGASAGAYPISAHCEASD
jgi:hypothetical protein